MAVTDPPDCVCGFMSVKRVYTLLDATVPRRDRGRSFREQQLAIFPNITFNCSGEVVKWIVGGRWRGFGNEFPELQIWRLSGESVYQKVNGTVIYALSDEDDDVYEYTVNPPLPFQPGDILGMFQPEESVLRLNYNRYSGSLYFTQYLFESGNSSNLQFDIYDGGIIADIGVPLVSASIGKI